MLVVIRGAGDIATGIALRLWRSGIQVVMTEIPQPTAIRRTVCFSEAIVHGEAQVEDVNAQRAETAEAALLVVRTQWWMPFWRSGIWEPGSRMPLLW